MEKIIFAQEAIYIIALINAIWAGCLWDDKVVLKKSTINRLKRVMISLDIVITASAIFLYAIEPRFLFADWVIVIYLAIAVVTQWMAIRFLRERDEQVPEEKRIMSRLADWIIALDKQMSGEIDECPGKSPEHSEK